MDKKIQFEAVVYDISHTDLTEEEAIILRKAVKEIQDKRMEKFQEHLDAATKIVESWPQWKQDLGKQMLLPSRPPRKKRKNQDNE